MYKIFFFFYRHYNPLWVLAFSVILFHSALSSHCFLRRLIPSICVVQNIINIYIYVVHLLVWILNKYKILCPTKCGEFHYYHQLLIETMFHGCSQLRHKKTHACPHKIQSKATLFGSQLTFRHRSSSIQDRRFTFLQRTLFIYLINKYISLSDICLTVHH